MKILPTAIVAVIGLFLLIRLVSSQNQSPTDPLSSLPINSRKSDECIIADWNKVHTEEVPYAAIHEQWARENISRRDNMMFGENRLQSAFVYLDKIAVVTTASHNFGQTVYCRYFDCKRKEIPNSGFKTIMFPQSTAYCVRRVGAEYMSLTSEPEDEPPAPVPLIFRAYTDPPHEFAVCVGPIYGDESHWLEIIEFIEHHKMVGITYFYFTLYNLNEYDRKVIDDYVRLGDVEVTFFQSEYETPGWQFHFIQQSECLQRSKGHTRWLLNIDIDERLTPAGNISIPEFLRTMPDNIAEISFVTNRIRRTDKLPEKYNETQLESEMIFKKYTNATPLTWYNHKGVYRPEHVGILFYHWSWRIYPGYRVLCAPKRIGYIRHYRTTDPNLKNGDWVKLFPDYAPHRLEPQFEQELGRRIGERAKYVYDQRAIRCEEIPEIIFRGFKRSWLSCKFGHELEEEKGVTDENI